MDDKMDKRTKDQALAGNDDGINNNVENAAAERNLVARPRDEVGNTEALRRGDTHSSISSSSSTIHESETDNDHDGHRPALREIRSTISRSSRNRVQGQAESATGVQASPSLARRDTVLSRIRSRPNPVFTHP